MHTGFNPYSCQHPVNWPVYLAHIVIGLDSPRLPAHAPSKPIRASYFLMDNSVGEVAQADDIKREELETLSAIYGQDISLNIAEYKAVASIPLRAENGITVCLLHPDGYIARTTKVTCLPQLTVEFTLPPGYPYQEPPKLKIHALTVTASEISELENLLALQWTGDQVLFTMIDYLQQKADNLQEWLGTEIRCSDVEYEQIIEHDQAEKQRRFDESVFTCGICQDEFRGDKCVQFDACGHIFCNGCLHDFFVSLISCGDVGKVHCPDFECGKQFLKNRDSALQLDNLESEGFDFWAFKTQLMTPPMPLGTLQKILADASLFSKYLTLFTDHQNAVIAKLFPSRLVSCPRAKCPAMIFRDNLSSRLVICRTCDYAFCNICRLSYHSDAINCSRKLANEQYHGIPANALEVWMLADKSSRERDIVRFRYGTEFLNRAANEYKMDKLFKEMLADSSQGFSKCPTCDLIVQKLEGCNKMKCWSCASFFCHLCGSLLDYSQPYEHFTSHDSPCYGRLLDGIITEE